MGFTRRDRADLAVLGLWVWALLAFGPVLHQLVPHGHGHAHGPAHGHAHVHAGASEHAAGAGEHAHPHPDTEERRPEESHGHGAFDPAHGGAHWLHAVGPEPAAARWLDLGLLAFAEPAAPLLARRWSPVRSQAP